MMKLFIIGLTFSLGSLLHAQQHDNIWLLSYQGGSQSPDNDTFGITVLDFTTGELNITDNQIIEMNFNGTNLSFCDKNGNLLYYTNGIYIEDTSFQTMLNGEDMNDWLLYGQTLPQGVLALPYPGNEEKSMLLNEEKGYIPGWSLEVIGLYYSIIDMEENNGLGEVILKKEPLIIDTLEYGKLTATKHANGRGWWIVINESHSNRFYKILLDNNGIEVYGNQTVGMPNEEGLGQAVFSPDGNNYVMFNAIDALTGQFVEIYDFDRCTGGLSNHRRIHLNSDGAGGIAISPNSRYLYVSSYEYIYQFDLWADDIEASKITVAVYDGYWSPLPTRFFLAQLAPDGKIYINCNNGVDILHVIHNPDEQGMACNVELHGIELPTYNAFSLPNYPNYRLGALAGSPCDTISTAVNDPPERSVYTLSLSPNPTSESFTVQFSNNIISMPDKWEAYTATGQIMASGSLGNEAQNISVVNWPAGLYVVKVFFPDGGFVSERLIVQR